MAAMILGSMVFLGMVWWLIGRKSFNKNVNEPVDSFLGDVVEKALRRGGYLASTVLVFGVIFVLGVIVFAIGKVVLGWSFGTVFSS